MSELKFKLESDDSKKLSIICGPVNSNLSKIEDSLSIKIKNRGSLFSLSGEDQNISKGRLVIEELFSFADQSKELVSILVYVTSSSRRHISDFEYSSSANLNTCSLVGCSCL